MSHVKSRPQLTNKRKWKRNVRWRPSISSVCQPKANKVSIRDYLLTDRKSRAKNTSTDFGIISRRLKYKLEALRNILRPIQCSLRDIVWQVVRGFYRCSGIRVPRIHAYIKYVLCAVTCQWKYKASSMSCTCMASGDINVENLAPIIFTDKNDSDHFIFIAVSHL